MTDAEILTTFIDTGTWKNGSPYRALSRLTAELTRKDAALREVLEWIEADEGFWVDFPDEWERLIGLIRAALGESDKEKATE